MPRGHAKHVLEATIVLAHELAAAGGCENDAVTRIIGHGIDGDDGFKTAQNLLKVAVIPIALSSVFAISVATWLGWWSRILHEDKPVQKWTKIIPISLLLVGVLCASWGNLWNQETDLFLTLVVMVLIVGFTEERSPATSASTPRPSRSRCS